MSIFDITRLIPNIISRKPKPQKGRKMKRLCPYFAYGSNLLPNRMFRRCPTAIACCPAVLNNYRLTERLYADVDYCPGSQVYGYLYFLRPADLAALDRYEGYPRTYKRYTVNVVLDDGTEYPALVYEMTEETKAARNGMAYPEEYRILCRNGARLRKIPNSFTRKRKQNHE